MVSASSPSSLTCRVVIADIASGSGPDSCVLTPRSSSVIDLPLAHTTPYQVALDAQGSAPLREAFHEESEPVRSVGWGVEGNSVVVER